MRERLQKVMAASGIGSRRGCEDLIRSGRVTVNNAIAVLGAKVDPEHDQIRVDGELLRPAEPHVYIALNKPVGVLTSLRSQGGRRTVRDLVPDTRRLYPVGRLDIDSEGLVLLTNDGPLAFRLTHPRFGHEKEYRVLLDRAPDDKQLETWRKGVVLPNRRRTRKAKVWIEATGKKGAWVGLIIREGRKRQIRELAKTLGMHVKKLIRVRIGTLELGSLQPGEYRHLEPAEVRKLTRFSGSSPEAASKGPRRRSVAHKRAPSRRRSSGRTPEGRK